MLPIELRRRDHNRSRGRDRETRPLRCHAKPAVLPRTSDVAGVALDGTLDDAGVGWVEHLLKDRGDAGLPRC